MLAKGGEACSLLRQAKEHRRLLWLSLVIAAALLVATSRLRGSKHGLPLLGPAAAPAAAAQGPREPRKRSAPECAAVDSSAIEGCLALSEACVDQGEVVMMGEEYQYDLLHPAWAPGAVPLPSFTPQLHYTLQYGRADSNGDFFGPPQPRYDPVPFRAHSWLEPTPDLQHPQFDDSTIPVVYHAAWHYNFAHIATAGLAWVYNNINQSSSAALAERARLVVRTPHGWAMPPFMPLLFQPLLRHPVTTFAELSQRPAAGSTAATPRCFCRLLICDGYGHTYTPNAWSAAQAVAAAVLPPSEPTAEPAAVQPPKLQLPGQEQQAGQQGLHVGEQPAVRRIVFHRRSTQVRQFLNLPDLLDRCSSWDWTAAATAAASGGVQPAGHGVGSGRQVQVECSAHAFKDLADSLAAAQAADVFVGTHGANLANGFFMRPGSAMVEVMNPQWVHPFNHYLNQDPRNGLIYFGLIVNDAAWSPGAFEQQQRAAGLNAYNGHPGGRDKNVHLKWEWLEPVLARIAALNGNVTAWRQLQPDQIILHVG